MRQLRSAAHLHPATPPQVGVMLPMLRRAPALGLDAFAVAAAATATVRAGLSLAAAPAAPASTSTVGTLHVVATPLGNAADVTLRALQTLRECDLVAAEDTRVTRRLLRAHGVDANNASGKTLLSCNDHNEGARVRAVLARLAAGGDVALVSDAGTPGVSDPGADVVAAAHAAGARVSPVPGPSALAAALSVAGVQTAADHGGEGALFLGFLPRHGPPRRRWLADIASAHARRVVVLFESPHRVLDTLAELYAWHTTLWGGGGGAGASGEGHESVGAPAAIVRSSALPRPSPAAPPPPRRVLVCRELTKRHEQVVLYDSVAAAHDGVAAQAQMASASCEARVGDGSDGKGRPPASRGAKDDDGDSEGRPLGEFVLLLHPMALPPAAAAGSSGGVAPCGPQAEGRDVPPAATTPPMPTPTPHGAPSADTPQQTLEDAVDVVRQLVAGHGARLSEAVTTAAAVAGVRRKALMLAVARAGVAAPCSGRA